MEGFNLGRLFTIMPRTPEDRTPAPPIKRKRPPTEAAYLVNQRNAANAAVITVEMRRPNAAAFNQSQTDSPVLRGGITSAKQHNIAKRSESQIWEIGGRVREYSLLNRVPAF